MPAGAGSGAFASPGRVGPNVAAVASVAAVAVPRSDPSGDGLEARTIAKTSTPLATKRPACQSHPAAGFLDTLASEQSDFLRIDEGRLIGDWRINHSKCEPAI
jgi:hypothetical protein